MAGELMAVPVLLGIGVHELSVEPTAVPEIKEAIARVDLATARRLANEALTMGTAGEVEALVRARFGQRFADLLAAGEGADLTDTGSIRLPEYRDGDWTGGGGGGVIARDEARRGHSRMSLRIFSRACSWS